MVPERDQSNLVRGNRVVAQGRSRRGGRRLLSPEAEARLAKGRRKGRKTLQQIIDEATMRGPKELLVALNFQALSPTEIATQRASSGATRLAKEYVRTVLLQELQDLATRLIAARGGKTNSLRAYLTNRLVFWGTITPGIWVQGGEKPTTPFSTKEEKRILSSIRRRSGVLLLRLWDAPAEWLERLRLCGRQWCEAPYFLDRSPAGRARHCSDRCRKAQHRGVDERRIRKLLLEHPQSSFDLSAYDSDT
jgi:hypothetical protein